MSSLQEKNCWSLGIKIFLLLIFSLFFCLVKASNNNINFEYPPNVTCFKEFKVNLTVFNFEGIYDVKIDILDKEGNRLAEIFNNGQWKSTYWYVKEIINTSYSDSYTFLINITKCNVGEATINVIIRKANTSTTYKFGPYYLLILENKESTTFSIEEKKDNIIKEENRENDKIVEKEEEENKNIIYNVNNNKNLTNATKIIILNTPKDIKTQKNKNYISNLQYAKDHILYIIPIFCIFVIFYMWKRL